MSRHLILKVSKVYEGPEIKDDDEHFGKILLRLDNSLDPDLANEIKEAVHTFDFTVVER